MAIVCYICKQPILDSQACIELDGHFIHLFHRGVAETIRDTGEIKIGAMLKLKQYPVKYRRSYGSQEEDP